MARTVACVLIILLSLAIGTLTAATAEQLYDRYWNEGNKHSEEGRWKEAAEAFGKAIRYFPALPANYGSYVNRGNAYSMQGKLELALKDYNKVLAAFPDKSVKELGEVYYNRGAAYDRNGKPELAIPDYEKAIAIDTGIRSVHNKLAWILATSSDDKLRNGAKAVKHGLIACEQTGNKNGYYLDTLAAAYAEAGDFAKAVETQRLAIELVADADDKAEMTGRVALYEQMKPYREPKKK